MPIIIKSRTEIDKMAASGQIVARVHAEMARLVRPGVTTIDLDAAAHRVITDAGAHPSFLGHHGFPASICTSVNEELVHGIPNSRPLEEGDVLSIDVGVLLDGYHGDAAVTYLVGECSQEDKDLVEVTEASFFAGLEQIRAGARLGDVSAAVQACIEDRGFGVIKGYGGHGIGRKLWEEPHIPNHGEPGTGARLRAGMTLAIEPMVSVGAPETAVLDDEWTVVIEDGSKSAHFEHTVLVTEDGARLLTIDE
jgi:methionyl aminopeptidase